MSDTVIKIEHLSKYYRLGSIGGKTLSDDINRWWAELRGKPNPLLQVGQEMRSMSMEDDFIWALRDINLEVKQGEVLGIIGRNGAGKSTLLKILSRITAPTSGQFKVKGRTASLLEVGTGFHPELTGRENIYLNGAILGMTKKEVHAKLDEIIDFSGVKKFVDTPVKRYSSGMKVRLAFSVAAHLDPEILIIDEVLAVGDAEFQKKCIGKMQDVAGEGRTVLFVSHNMASVKNLCTRAILLGEGNITKKGTVDEIVSSYLDHHSAVDYQPEILKSQIEKMADGVFDKINPAFSIEKIRIENSKSELCKQFYSDENIFVAIAIKINYELHDLRVICEIVDDEGSSIVASQASDQKFYLDLLEQQRLQKGHHVFKCKIPGNFLSERKYFISIQIINVKTQHIKLQKALYFDVLFKGYNNIQYGSWSKSFLRPLFNWQVDKIS